MSPSEQEIKSQVAQMREGLRSARAAARTGKVVGILGVLVGLGIVAIYVVSFIRLGQSVANIDALSGILKERVERLRIEDSLRLVVQEASPVVWEEARGLLKDSELPQMASDELRVMVKDLEPVLRQELERVRPRLERILEDQREEVVADMQALVEAKVGDRLAQIVERHGIRLGEQTGLDKEALAELVVHLEDASLEALKGAVQRRAGNLEREFKSMGDLLGKIPALEEKEEEVLLTEIRDVLIALLKHKLPDYKFEEERAVPADFAPAAPLVPAEAKEAAEEARRKGIEAAAAAAEAARKAAAEAGAAAPGAAPTEPSPEARKRIEEGRKKAAEAAAKAAEEGGQ